MSGHLDGPPPGPPDPPYIPGDMGAPSAEEFARRRASSEPRPDPLGAFPGVEQPDAAPEPALLFMSWRAALASVHGRIEDAYALRRVWFQHAFDAGFTCAQIGEATRLSAAAVHKVIGTQRKRDLDSAVASSPAVLVFQKRGTNDL